MDLTKITTKKKIGIVDGGLGDEREKSIKYSKTVSKILAELGMNVTSFHLHPNGAWTVDGEVKNLEESLKKIDSVWNCLVGSDGEKGIIEKLCEKCKVDLIGHGSLHTHLSANKKNLHHALTQHKIKTPYGKIILQKDYNKEKLLDIFKSVGIPSVVKPLSGSNMFGITLVNNFTELENAAEYLISKNMDVLVEKVITGVPVTCFVLEHNNLFQTSINNNFEDTNFKLSKEDLLEIRNTALYIHNVLAYKHHAEYDFILSKNIKNESVLYFIEANTHPSLNQSYIKNIFDGAVSFKDYISSKF